MPLVLHAHDGTTNSRTMNALVQNFSAAAATDLENGQKMACMRLLLAFRNASAAAAETSTGDFGLAETVVNAPSMSSHILTPRSVFLSAFVVNYHLLKNC